MTRLYNVRERLRAIEAGREAPWRGKHVLLAALFLLTAVILWFTSVRLPGTNYNLVGLAPAILLALHLLAQRHWAGRRPAIALLLVAFAASGASLAYRTALTWESLNGFPADRFRAEVAWLAEVEGTVGVSSQLIPYVAQALPGARLLTWPRAEFVDTDQVRRLRAQPPATLIVQQADSGAATAPVLPGYRLIIDRFHASPPAIAGVPIGRTRKDFAYAVYCRAEACAALLQHSQAQSSIR